MKERFNRIAQRLMAEGYEEEAKRCLAGLIPTLLSEYEKLFGEQVELENRLDVRVSDDGLPEGKVGAYKLDDSGEHGVLTVSPGAFTGERAPYQFVIMHELIHVLLKNPEDPHSDEFETLANAVGLPEKYRN